MLDDIIKNVGHHMDVSIVVLERELKAVRTGRASTSFVENLLVNVYGGTSPLNTIATLAVPEARLLVVQPWDKSVISDIERAIEKSELGITPSNDGTVIRLPFPPLSADRRQDLVKVVKSKVEEAKIAIRNIRREAQEDIREAEQEKVCSQDQARKGQQDLQNLTDVKIEQVDGIGDRKQEEVLEV